MRDGVKRKRKRKRKVHRERESFFPWIILLAGALIDRTHMDSIAYNHKSTSTTHMNTNTFWNLIVWLTPGLHTHIHRLLMDSVNQVRTCISEHGIRFQETYVHLDWQHTYTYTHSIYTVHIRVISGGKRIKRLFCDVEWAAAQHRERLLAATRPEQEKIAKDPMKSNFVDLLHMSSLWGYIC